MFAKEILQNIFLRMNVPKMSYFPELIFAATQKFNKIEIRETSNIVLGYIKLQIKSSSRFYGITFFL